MTLAAEQFRQTTKRSTISADDVLKALQEVEFQELVPALELQLSLIRKAASEKRLKTRKRQAGKSNEMDIDSLDSEKPDDNEAQNGTS